MDNLYWRALAWILRLFFSLLYGPFAWTYDAVSAAVSLGHWRSWVLSPLPYLAGPVVLELGHGPGHLLAAMTNKGILAVGLDRSQQMGRLALFNGGRKGLIANVINGYAQFIPFSSAAFDQVVSTFPAEYFWDPRTLSEIFRVLKPGGSLLTLPVAWITGQRPLERAARRLFQITGQAPTHQTGPFLDELNGRLETAGFQVEIEYQSLVASTVLILLARKPGAGVRPML